MAITTGVVPQDPELVKAREWLRAAQREHPLPRDRPGSTSTLSPALRHLSEFLKVERTGDPDIVRRAGLRYVLAQEEDELDELLEAGEIPRATRGARRVPNRLRA